MMTNAWLQPVRTPRNLMIFSACLLVASMVVSPFLLSISMWGLAAAALWQSAEQLKIQGKIAGFRPFTTWWQAIVYSFQTLWKNRPLCLMSLLLLVPALSIGWSDDLAYWLRVTRVRIPFFVMPWAFANLPALNRREHHLILYLLVWFMVLMCLGVGVNFLLHYDAIITGLGKGQPVPVPREHVRFSLVLATAILSGGWLWKEHFFLKFEWERRALLAAVAFMFLFIHILSVRGGIAVLYSAIFFSIAWYVWSTRRWLAGAGIILAISVTLWGAVETIPSLRIRLAYMKYDWERYKTNTGVAYSDAERWISLQVGMKIWQEHPLLGAGAGDLKNEVTAELNASYPEYARFPKLPHNQWIHIMASTGIFGLLLSLAGFLAPLFDARNRRYLFVTFQLMAFLTFLIECTVENAIGVSWYLFYTLWFMGSLWQTESESPIQ